MSQVSPAKKWHKTDLLVLSDETNLSLILRELVRPLNWKVTQTTQSAAEAVEVLNIGAANALIIIDSQTLSAAECLRCIFKNATARLTPTLVLAPENLRHDMLIYEKIFRVHVAPKPLTPNTFLPAFKQMLRTWEMPAMSVLRKITPFHIDGDTGQKLEILRKLRVDSTALPLTLQAEVAVLMDQGQTAEAELKILETFKIFPNNANIMAQIAWFYLSAKMPDQALLYLKKLKSAALTSVVFDLDLAAAHLSKNNLSEALPCLIAWRDAHPTNDVIQSQIARILVSDGLADRAENFGVAKGVVRKTIDAWDQFDRAGSSPPVMPAGGSKAS
jgi:hypothetical protein